VILVADVSMLRLIEMLNMEKLMIKQALDHLQTQLFSPHILYLE